MTRHFMKLRIAYPMILKVDWNASNGRVYDN